MFLINPIRAWKEPINSVKWLSTWSNKNFSRFINITTSLFYDILFSHTSHVQMFNCMKRCRLILTLARVLFIFLIYFHSLPLPFHTQNCLQHSLSEIIFLFISKYQSSLLIIMHVLTNGKYVWMLGGWGWEGGGQMALIFQTFYCVH